MNTQRILGLAATAATLAGAASAQLADVLICDPINDEIFLFSDTDGDGFYLSAGEARLLVDLALASPNGASPETLEVRTESGAPVLYWVEDFTDVGTSTYRDGVWRAVDASGDGVIQLGEITHFYDANADVGSVEPEGLELTPDGAVWFSSDWETTEGILRLLDGNADGDAMDAGERQILVDGSAGVPITVETDSGPQLADTDDFTRMMKDGNGIIVYGDGDDEAAFRFEDINGDGDVADPGEARLFFNASGKNTSLPQQADFASGTLRSLLITDPACCAPGSYYGRLNHLTEIQNGPTTEYYFACDSSNSSDFTTSDAGLGLNGLVYQGIDGNGDGDIQDAGEVKLFYDASSTGPLPLNEQVVKIVGMDSNDGWIYLADLNNKETILRLKDLNGDGDAMDLGVLVSGVPTDERQYDRWDFATWGMNPPFLSSGSFGPFINDLASNDAGAWGAGGASNFVVSGTGCSTFGTIPAITGAGSAQIGTSNFVCGLTNTGPNLPALLYYGTSTSHWLGAPVLPLDLTPFGYSGCTMYHNILGFFPAVTDGSGAANLPVPIPNDPALVSLPIHLQWLAVDFTVVGIALSELGTVTIE